MITEMQTRATLVAALRELPIERGDRLLVHTALSHVGFVSGGPQTFIEALIDVVGPTGTIVMPTHTPDLTEPSRWRNPPADSSLWQGIRDTLPAFDPARTPCRFMGVVPETFRTWPGVLRSDHPQVSFAAWGRHAAELLRDHPLSFGLGEGSPLARLEALGGRVLLVGCGYESCTMLHLSEHRAAGERGFRIREGAPMLRAGRRAWVEFDDLALDAEMFPAIGAAFEAVHPEHVSLGRIGRAEARVVDARALVAYGVEALR